VFLSVLVLHACKNKETTQSYCEQNPDGCQSISEAKDFFAFKLGSWWVYEEENTLQRDSMYVIESSINPNGYEFDVLIQSDLTGYRYNYWPVYYGNKTGCSENGNISNRCMYVKRSKGKSQDYLGSNNCFFIKYELNAFDYVGGSMFCENKVIFSAIKNSFKLNNLKFKKTIDVTETCSQNEGYQKTITSYAQNVGIVRKELVDSNQVWNLVNYHIQE
jgi:hypothetical protein